MAPCMGRRGRCRPRPTRRWTQYRPDRPSFRSTLLCRSCRRATRFPRLPDFCLCHYPPKRPATPRSDRCARPTTRCRCQALPWTAGFCRRWKRACRRAFSNRRFRTRHQHFACRISRRRGLSRILARQCSRRPPWPQLGLSTWRRLSPCRVLKHHRPQLRLRARARCVPSLATCRHLRQTHANLGFSNI